MPLHLFSSGVTSNLGRMFRKTVEFEGKSLHLDVFEDADQNAWVFDAISRGTKS